MAIYLDHAATTPLDKNVLDKMMPYLTENFGNASSQHSFGRTAANAVVAARDSLANIMGCKAEELFFTGSGTEADNWALKGMCSCNASRGKHIVLSAIEHPALIESARDMQKQGFELTLVNPDKNGIVTAQSIKDALRADTVFCGVMHANNETGVIQPIEEISKVLKERNVPFFCDCVQTAGVLPLPIKYVDALSVSAHKFYGPKGVGLLYLQKNAPIHRFISGGHQERGLRGGTTNVAGIVGLAEAFKAASENMEKNNEKIVKLRDAFVNKILAEVKEARLIGENAARLPGHANIAFEGYVGSSIVMSLDNRNIAASAGAACSTGAVKASPVLLAMGISQELAKSAVRFTFGKNSTVAEMDKAISVLISIIESNRKILEIKQRFAKVKKN